MLYAAAVLAAPGGVAVPPRLLAGVGGLVHVERAAEVILAPGGSAVVGVDDPVVGGQHAVAGDVVAEVVVGDRDDAVGVDVDGRFEGLVGEGVARRLVDLDGRRPRQPAVVGVRHHDEVVAVGVVLVVLPGDVHASAVRAVAVVDR